jgi:uncharacterized membrane protein YeaQ/YmgE (transglycosylase-associated protein family)
MSIIWTIIIGFVAGLIAKWIMPGRNEPSGFILTTILGIVGALVATYLGQALGWYRADEGAGFIGAIVGAVIVLFIYGLIAGRRHPTDRSQDRDRNAEGHSFAVALLASAVVSDAVASVRAGESCLDGAIADIAAPGKIGTAQERQDIQHRVGAGFGCRRRKAETGQHIGAALDRAEIGFSIHQRSCPRRDHVRHVGSP